MRDLSSIDHITATAKSLSRIPIRVRFIGLVLVAFLVSAATCLWAPATGGYLNSTPEPGDGQGYDMIAFTLSRGLGFGYFWSDPDYRAPYIRDNANGKWDFLLRRKGEYTPTAYRPPALPVILSFIYRIIGRDFRVWRIFEAILVSGAITLAAVATWRVSGVLAASTMVAFALHDDVLITYSTQYATEGIAVLGVTLLAWSLLQYANVPSSLYAAFAGLSFGSMVLTRNIFILWCPVILALIWWLAWNVYREHCKRHVAVCVMLFLAGACLVPLPWWIRNCVVLESFMPFGTQGGINLPHGYSAYAVLNRGLWTEDAYAEFDPIAAQISTMKPIIAERERASFGTKIALKWIVEHPRDTAQLVLDKIFYLWQADVTRYWPLMILAVIGVLGLARGHRVVLVTLILANTFAVALTYWDPLNRFTLPVHLILYIAAGAGVQGCVLGMLYSLKK